ncbi:DNA-binding LacI/PurR family transcriptional regulator [Motilibacter peucedani]|uniref:DNA-binding LacI/PurR family transcriptional regulator n=1 Tax=Motilibacter peucedani TaxID=598650 RepID=A0A420XTD6_9ACTN|nr:LacI family DNA-binding transcriptional regulator [Motilibacter peucedani]RKS79939.1 DNA-binding LacI/PurR family transcriptional regulator [Motilibacter peucedani]
MPQGSQPRRVTLRDIAERAGVSVSAVSMALADHERIGAGTKEEIRAVAQELGYVTNSAARALRGQRSGTLALVVPATGQHVFGHPYFMHLLDGVNEVVNEVDGTLLISTNPDERHGVAAYERVLRSRAADGAIVASAAANDANVLRLLDSGVPVVLIGRFPRIDDAVTVGLADVEGARTATEHLLSHGSKRVAHIAGPRNHQTTTDRIAGFRSAHVAHGVTAKPPVVHGDFGEESGRAAAARLLDQFPDLDAIFAANDEMAFGALCELRSRGLDAPGNVRLVGYDDFGVSRLTTPALTTVTVPAAEVGRRAARRLLQLIDGSVPEPRHETLPVHLTTRQSCGC